MRCYKLEINQDQVKKWYESFRNKQVLVNYSLIFYRGSKKVNKDRDILASNEIKNRMKSGQLYVSPQYYRKFDSINAMLRKTIMKYTRIQFYDGNRSTHKDVTKINSQGLLNGYCVPVSQLRNMEYELSKLKTRFIETRDQFILDYPAMRVKVVNELVKNHLDLRILKYAEDGGLRPHEVKDNTDRMSIVQAHVDAYRKELLDYYPTILVESDFKWSVGVEPPAEYGAVVLQKDSLPPLYREFLEGADDSIFDDSNIKTERLAGVMRSFESAIRNELMPVLKKVLESIKKTGKITKFSKNSLMGYSKEVKGKKVIVRGILEKIIEYDVTGSLFVFIDQILKLIDQLVDEKEDNTEELAAKMQKEIGDAITNITEDLADLDISKSADALMDTISKADDIDLSDIDISDFDDLDLS